jgi:osmotically inducible lipoprotein OsmB
MRSDANRRIKSFCSLTSATKRWNPPRARFGPIRSPNGYVPRCISVPGRSDLLQNPTDLVCPVCHAGPLRNCPSHFGIFLPPDTIVSGLCQVCGGGGESFVESQVMRRTLVVIAMALALAGCANGRQDRVLGGAVIGGGTGALIGGLAGRTAGAAVAGGLIGAVAGAIIADATRPGWCYYWRNHRRHYVRC